MLVYISLGLFAGICSGVFGIGGAVILVPALVLSFGFTQKIAQGTTLLMFLAMPSLLSGIQYYRAGNADVKTAIFLWIGMFIGSAIGAWLVNTVFKDSELFMILLKKSFSLIMIFLAVKLWLS